MGGDFNMDIDALRGFLAFVETSSFTRAAKQINRTQSAFSAQMRKLEEELNVTLFQKEGRNLILTEAGLALRSHAEQLVALHNTALKQVKRYEDKKPLRLGCPEDYNDTILPKVIRLLQKAEPTCSIQVFSLPSITLREWLDDGRLDAAIVTRAPDSEEGHWLTSDTGVWISSPDYAFDGSKPVPLALFQTDCKYHAAAVNGLTKQGTPYQLLACSNTASAQRAIVKAGLAIGAMGKLSVTSDLKILEDMPPLPSVDIVLILASKHHPVLDKEVLNQLVELDSD
ncbi:LysR family transcriptional regulator [Vibrio lentus]|uniref:LysR family transcriptional regulator n=1 Tax=Vibrio lentus TaxID=136468 RepID=UPI000C82B169|nr:LysR substrate-binding domain-containing protein [Vibrio lentus]MCC4781359.1 LysR family transcriptional regulator [Vibrio lentus]PMI93695.1 LysR family transcriptional regulator [Vibrio lentus]PMJ06398.1 LysR family transcriptional regulator [Vibrio lentus]PML47826.1 LysR family transcriptional regulator [Vibrio lentus]PMN29349.1 LysR family transcriptional regulator [Vibrio lentus]